MPSLSEIDRQALLTFARRVVVESVTLGRIPDDIPNKGIFAERCGVFVTLRKGGCLCGCIGVTHADASLGDAIARCAAGAALQDPRFAPVRVADLSHLQLEISLLSPSEPIDLSQIEIGRHGLVAASGNSRGLLLPQVATEHRFTREEFLGATCRKAGLPPDAWRDPRIQILAFTCEVVSDEGRTTATPRPLTVDSKNENPRDVQSRGPEKPSCV
ncbi:MAG: AmmeMemoRadiSam system protein A [Candidatus Acidiferrum sp.]|jgi:AmmeMemoRadiSam system protein A